jgi:hypothetical protein
MNYAQFIDRYLAVAANFFPNQSWFDWEFKGLKIRIIRAGTGNCDHQPKLLNRKIRQQGGDVRSATKNSRTTTTLCPTTETRKGWVVLGATIIRTTSRQYIGGAMKKKDQQGWTDLRPINIQVSIEPIKYTHWNRSKCGRSVLRFKAK